MTKELTILHSGFATRGYQEQIRTMKCLLVWKILGHRKVPDAIPVLMKNESLLGEYNVAKVFNNEKFLDPIFSSKPTFSTMMSNAKLKKCSGLPTPYWR